MHPIWHGRQLAAARALANMTIRNLADAASTTKRVVSDLELNGAIEISRKRRHGHTSRDLWDRIVAALAARGVEMTLGTDRHGGGVRWIAPEGPQPDARSSVSSDEA